MHLCQDLLQRHRACTADPGPAESENARDEVTRAVRRHHDVLDVAALEASRGAVLPRELRVAEHRAQHVVEVMGDAAGERPECLELLRLVQLRGDALVTLELPQEGDQQHRGQRADDEGARDILPGLARQTPRMSRSLRATSTTAG